MNKEFLLQVAVVEHIKMNFPTLFFFHCPNRPGDATDGYFKQIMGAKAGVSDLLFSWNFGALEVGVIELKVDSGISSQQNKFLSAVHQLGWKHAVCKTVRSVHETLKKWGHKPVGEGIQEPDYRTKEEKFKQIFDMYKP